MALETDSRVEVYEDRKAGKGGVRLLWLPDTRSAAIGTTMEVNGHGRAPATRRMLFGGTMMGECSREAT
jgi:hypothetical protein